ncbi:MAG: hypothetical protein JXR71_03555 [Bacteroidales bacterium]|nr:hypothetical protein [Bacteroidales bacterium]
MKHILLYLLIVFLFPPGSIGQIAFSDYYTFGSNAVSEGLYFQDNILARYAYGKFSLGAGVQLTAGYSDQQLLSGLLLEGTTTLFADRFPVVVSLLFLRRPYSRLLSENNFSLTVQHRWKHLELILGNNIRIWRLSRNEMRQLGMSGATDLGITEYRNLVYRLTWYLKPIGSVWNLSLSLTDFDDFLIQRGTNPMLAFGFEKVLQPDLELFSQLWYQGAGMFNLQADYFGFYFKTGIRWQF